MHCELFLRDNIVYIPTSYRIERMHRWMADPVAIIPVDDGLGLQRTIVEYLAKGNPVIPMPTPKEQNSKPDILKYVKDKTWVGFTKKAETWSIGQAITGEFNIVVGVRGKHGTFLNDWNGRITLPVGTTLDEVAARTVLEIQAKAREIADAR